MVVISFIARLEFIAYCTRCTTRESEKIVKIKFVDISQTKSASEITFSALRKAIIEGDITVGTPRHQDDLARSVQTSRIPIGEALSCSEEQDLIRIQRVEGPVVVGLIADEASEILNLRALLEPDILKNAVPQMSDSAKKLAIFQSNDFSESADPSARGGLN